MQDLIPATPPDKPTTKPHGPALIGPLKCWLLDERSDEVAIRTIRASDILTRQAREAMPAIRAEAMRPATVDEIKAIVGSRFVLFPQPSRKDGEWSAWWADYIDALAGLTPFAVEAGMAAWVRSPEAEFMCKPGNLRELALKAPNENRWAKALYRAEAATRERRPPEPVKAIDRPSPEEVAAVMTEFHRVMQAKDPLAKIRTKGQRPTPCAMVDETGVSEEARAMLAERFGSAVEQGCAA